MANKGSFKKGEKRPGQGKRGPGKVTLTVKQAFEAVFKDLQADPKQPHALKAWAETQPTEFYKLAAKLIPSEIKGDLTHTHKVPGVSVVASTLGLGKKKP
jgi:hypothetical protein